MAKWFRENAMLVSAGTLLVASVIFATAGLVEWAADHARYLGYGAFALFLLGLGLYQLRRWGQRRSWDERSKHRVRRSYQAIATVLILAGLALKLVELFEKGTLSTYGWATFTMLLCSLALFIFALVADRPKPP